MGQSESSQSEKKQLEIHQLVHQLFARSSITNLNENNSADFELTLNKIIEKNANHPTTSSGTGNNNNYNNNTVISPAEFEAIVASRIWIPPKSVFTRATSESEKRTVGNTVVTSILFDLCSSYQRVMDTVAGAGAGTNSRVKTAAPFRFSCERIRSLLAFFDQQNLALNKLLQMASERREGDRDKNVERRVKIAERMISEFQFDINYQDPATGNTALHFFCAAPINTEDDEKEKADRIVDFLILGACKNNKNPKTGDTPVHALSSIVNEIHFTGTKSAESKSGDRCLNELIASPGEKCHVLDKNNQGDTPLQMAIEAGNTRVMTSIFAGGGSGKASMPVHEQIDLVNRAIESNQGGSLLLLIGNGFPFEMKNFKPVKNLQVKSNPNSSEIKNKVGRFMMSKIDQNDSEELRNVLQLVCDVASSPPQHNNNNNNDNIDRNLLRSILNFSQSSPDADSRKMTSVGIFYYCLTNAKGCNPGCLRVLLDLSSQTASETSSHSHQAVDKNSNVFGIDLNSALNGIDGLDPLSGLLMSRDNVQNQKSCLQMLGDARVVVPLKRQQKIESKVRPLSVRTKHFCVALRESSPEVLHALFEIYAKNRAGISEQDIYDEETWYFDDMEREEDLTYRFNNKTPITPSLNVTKLVSAGFRNDQDFKLMEKLLRCPLFYNAHKDEEPASSSFILPREEIQKVADLALTTLIESRKFAEIVLSKEAEGGASHPHAKPSGEKQEVLKFLRFLCSDMRANANVILSERKRVDIRSNSSISQKWFSVTFPAQPLFHFLILRFVFDPTATSRGPCYEIGEFTDMDFVKEVIDILLAPNGNGDVSVVDPTSGKSLVERMRQDAGLMKTESVQLMKRLIPDFYKQK